MAILGIAAVAHLQNHHELALGLGRFNGNLVGGLIAFESGRGRSIHTGQGSGLG